MDWAAGIIYNSRLDYAHSTKVKDWAGGSNHLKENYSVAAMYTPNTAAVEQNSKATHTNLSKYKDSLH